MPLLSRPTTEMFTCFFFTPKILARAEKKTDMVGVGEWDGGCEQGIKRECLPDDWGPGVVR